MLKLGLSSIRDLHAKLKRDASALDDEVTSDRMFNFVVTAYSMIEWIKNDPSVPKAAKDAKIVQGLYHDQWLKICGDLATGCKHFTLNQRKPITSSAASQTGWGADRFGKGGWGRGRRAHEFN